MKFDGGVLAATLTSFTADMSVDWDDMKKQAERLVPREGFRGFVVNAYAGEGPALSHAERAKAVALHRECAKPDQPVIAAVLDISTAGAVKQAKEAKEAGADAILVCPPIASSWNAAASPELAERYHKEIADAVDLPMVLFQLAVGDPTCYPHELLLKLADDIPAVFAVKMAQANDAVRYDLDYVALKSMSKEILCLPAVGSVMFHNLLSGADGLLTGLVCLMPDEVIGLWQAVQKGDIRKARDIHFRIAPINHMIYGNPYVDLHTRYKELAYMVGAVSSPEVRGPMARVSEAERVKLRTSLVNAGFVG